MTFRRVLLLAGLLLVLFLAMYSWNRRTQLLDDLAANVGLEITATILGPLRAIQDTVTDFWDRYFDLVHVREENVRLKARLHELEAHVLATGEDLAELKRLRELVQFPVDVRWRPLAARVLAGKMGPNGVLDSITISRGYVTGARPGVPLVTHQGLVGRVLRSSAHASTVLLITDPGSNVAVFGQESRAPGILKGSGMSQDLEVNFVQRDGGMKNGELLITSGLDNKYPKGLPVGRVTSIAPSDYTQFMAVAAKPMVDLRHLEEVLLLEKSGVDLPQEEPTGPAPTFTGPPIPPHLMKKQAAAKNQQSPDAPASTSVPVKSASPAAPAASTPTPATSTANIPVSAPPTTPGTRAPNTPAANTGNVSGASSATPASSETVAPSRPAQRPQTKPRPKPLPAKPDRTNIPTTPDGAPRYRIITP